MVTQREWIQPIRNGFREMRAHSVTSATARDGEVTQRHNFCHPEVQFAIQSQVM